MAENNAEIFHLLEVEGAQGYTTRSVCKSEPGSRGGANVSSFDLSCTQKSFFTRLIGYCRVILNASNDLEKHFKLCRAAR